MAKFGDLEIEPPHGGSSCGFTSQQVVHSSVGVHAGGSSMTVEVYRDEEPVIKSTNLTLEEAWVLYTTLRGMFYKTRKAEQELYGNPHIKD